jgi:GNAT superfamily N-acetyltransferase
LVAVVKHDDGGEEIVGGGRYVMLQPGRAEAAFTVVDQYQGRGLGTVLLRHLAAVAGGAGIHELVAEVLPDNTPMLEVFENSGFPLTSRREPGVVHVTLRLH